MFTQNNWLKLSVVLLVALFTKVILAAESRGSRSNRNAASSSEASYSRPSNMLLDAGLGLTIIGSSVGLGVNVSPMWRISDSEPIYLGADTGIKLFSYGYSGYGYRGYGGSSTTVLIIPVAATAQYRFRVPGHPNFTPYAGVSLGIAFAAAGGYTSDVGFAFYPKGGASWRMSKTVSLNAELRFGVLYHFFFEPSGAVTFHL